MSEKKLEADIVEIRKRMANLAEIGPWSAIPLSRAEVHALLDELERLRADPATGWREGIEAAAKVCDERGQWAEDKIKDGDDLTFAHYSNACNDCAEMVRSLSPPAGDAG